MPAGPARRQVLRSLGGTAIAVVSGIPGSGRAAISRPERPSHAPADGSTRSVEFDRATIDPDPPAGPLRFVAAADLTGNGRDDVVVGCAGEPTNLWLFGERTGLPSRTGLRYELGRGDPTLFWYENPGWQRHDVAAVPGLTAGGALADLTGDGRLDVVLGRSSRDGSLVWFEQPADPRDPWAERLVTDRFGADHDVAFFDIDGDGEPEVVGLAPADGTLWYHDVPDDPRRSPWAAERRHVVAKGTTARGVKPVDLDGDGRTELLVDGSIFRRSAADEEWVKERVASRVEAARMDAADLDDDGALEVVIAGGRLAGSDPRAGDLLWFDPPNPNARLLRSGPCCVHSLDIADVDGDGRPDIVVAERGPDRNDPGRLAVYVNRRGVGFHEQVLSRELPTSRATIADLTGDGTPDVVGVSSGEAAGVHAWVNAS